MAQEKVCPLFVSRRTSDEHADMSCLVDVAHLLSCKAFPDLMNLWTRTRKCLLRRTQNPGTWSPAERLDVVSHLIPRETTSLS
jgi:hypothetical protein